jgi:serine/threonine protein phosphatase PrpC
VTTAAAHTDVGRVREGNEDAFLVDPTLGLYAVADGMGGHSAGEIASRIAVETLGSFVKSSGSDSGITWPYGFDTNLSFEANQLKSAVQLANQQIRFAARQQAELDGMGSTIIAVLVRGSLATMANVGDSRLYRWRRAELSQLSEDDSWAASMLKAGVDPAFIKTHAMRHMLTRALGTEQAVEVRAGQVTLEVGDVLLLCSDGLHGALGDAGIAAVLGRETGDLDSTARALIAAANEAGGPDNVTALLVRCDEASEPTRPWRLADQSGQTTSEYLAAAGVLVAIGIMMSAMMTDATRAFMQRIAYELQFLTP